MMKLLALLGAFLATASSFAQPLGGLTVDVTASRNVDDAVYHADAVHRRFAANATKLSMFPLRTQWRATGRGLPVASGFPAAVYLMRGGRWIGPAGGGSRSGGEITLAFDASGERAFPVSYRAFLQGVFDRAKPTIEAIFGPPAQGGTVRVTNYDADIGDRDAVAGGYFLPNNGAGEMEIRFPIYNSSEAGAVNFLHTVLLAYLGPRPFPYESWNEGLVRAATMRIARTPGSLPADLNQGQIEAVLESTYDVSPFYDWYNQKALSGPYLIAPNLRSVALPSGGSLGGVYLLRYQMAGSSFQKALVQYPAFAAKLNELYRASFASSQNLTALRNLGQQALNTLSGSGNATLEGQPFADWCRRQHVLDPSFSAGLKLVNQPFPILTELAGSDFGVFAVQATFFETLPNGNEVLLSGTSYPIFWGHDFIRIFTSIQDEQIDIAGAYGSVVPNFPSSVTDGAIYRVACDVPAQDQLARVYLPAGAIATANQTTPNNFYGTVAGLSPTDTRPLSIRVSFGNETVENITVVNFAFGTKILRPGFNQATSLTIEVVRNGSEVVLTRTVNKGPGPIGVDLRVGAVATQSVNLPKGVSTVGFSIEPDIAGIAETLDVNGPEILAARWNPTRSRYDLYPGVQGFRLGHGHFLRMNQPKTVAATGTGHGSTPMAVALKPGWNLISPPTAIQILTSNVQVVEGRNSPLTFAESLGKILGNEFFTFQPGPVDPSTGAPETGTMVPATSFEPGRAYFVRCLAAEGATLLFSPPNGRSRGAPERPRPGPRWEIQAILSSGAHRAMTTIGQARGASRRFDAKEDSQLPPGLGGMQIASSGDYSRDIRTPDSSQVHRLTMTGLQRGRKYVVLIKETVGRAGEVWLKHIGTSYKRKWYGNGYYLFVARGSTEEIDVFVGGAKP